MAVKIGIIGCGNISSVYLKNLTQVENLEVAACADIVPERAMEKASQFKIPRACTPDELLSDPEIEIVVNLTIPEIHAEISLKTLNFGKSVYSEKPLATNLGDAKKILEIAKSKNLVVGCAPDTFFSKAYQSIADIRVVSFVLLYLDEEPLRPENLQKTFYR